MAAGRYAPSPTGDLHLGNLRTALIAWAAARSTDRNFYLRLEDLDRGRSRDPQPQIDDLRAIGVDWDGDIVVQSARLDHYERALKILVDKGLVFECFCSRQDIREASSAAHAPLREYPGTCLRLSETERERRRSVLAENGRQPALRLRPRTSSWAVRDLHHGDFEGPIGNVVLQRGDGEFAYNLAVVVDDVSMGVDQVVRADDLLTSAPIHAYLAQELGGSAPLFGHVPLVLGPTGKRLAKRDGAVTLSDLAQQGTSAQQVVSLLAGSLGMHGVTDAAGFLEAFPIISMPQEPWVYDPPRPSH